MAIKMQRSDYNPTSDCDHAGLLLERGFNVWGDDHSEKIMQIHQTAASIDYSSLYERAYQNWEKILSNNTKNSKILEATLENRMYLGMGEASPLEAGITLHHTYGVPFISGSAIKGICHHYAENIGTSKAIIDILFGKEPDPNNNHDSGEAGYIIFNDAWWIPKGKALVPEIITVHYPKYFDKKGGANTDKKQDFESPNPNPQIAIQGSFLFSVEGEQAWAEYAKKLLKHALQESGIGGKTSSGYGFFTEGAAGSSGSSETWENTTLTKINVAGAGLVVEAINGSKKASVKWDKIKPQIDKLNLSKAKLKKLGKPAGIKQNITVIKQGNTYLITAVN